jgi:hypothetical protein
LRSQVQNEFDFDPVRLPQTVVNLPSGATQHVVQGLVTITDTNRRYVGPMVVRSGAELRIARSSVELLGDLTLEDGSVLRVIDADFLLPNPSQREHEIVNEGALIHTERARFGSGYVGTALNQTRLLHLRGTWLARDTVVQGLITIVSNGRNGWFGDPRYKGGSTFAVGMYEGDRADALHLAGMGDADLANGTMNVGLYYEAGGHTAPQSATIDLQSRTGLTLVYGDPAVHAGVTNPIDRSACRLALRNHRSPTWQFFAVNATNAAPMQTLTLRNAEGIICNFRGIDLVGTPILGGPWSSYYASLPGLPSTSVPGFHGLPPGCSVALGNVTFRSGNGASDWNYIRAWGLYSRGAATNLSIQGPSRIAEIELTDGRMALAGLGSFDMGIFANAVRLYGTADLDLDNVLLGEIGTGATSIGLVEANDQSRCSIDGARLNTYTVNAKTRLRTTGPQASITAAGVFGAHNLLLEPNGGGSVTLAAATPAQSFDLQNLDFESPLLAGGTPPYWSAIGVGGTTTTVTLPGAPGLAAYAATSQTGTATLRKTFALPPETVLAAQLPLQLTTLGAGASATLRVGQGAMVGVATADPLRMNAWQILQSPPVALGSGNAYVEYAGNGLPIQATLDDVRVQIASWWEDDNLANLDFEGEVRNQGTTPAAASAPDFWTAFQCRTETTATITRPGAGAGSRAVQVSPTSSLCNLSKSLSFLRAGDRVRFTGWVRGTPATAGRISALVGNGVNFFVVAPPNVFSGPILCDGTWYQFDITYVVPNNPSFTRLDVSARNMAGATVWFDDFRVEITRP